MQYFGEKLSGLKEPSSQEIAHQIEYHTVYFFQVLTLDRGTTSGLLIHNQNDVGILGSIPSEVNRDLLIGWKQKVSPLHSSLVDLLVDGLPEGSIVTVDEKVKKTLAQNVREFYQKYPEALKEQAKGFTVPDTVGNHQSS